MGDTISRLDAIDAANDWLLDCFKVQKQDRSCGLIRRLEDLPSAQPEIIRCKDCRYWDKNKENGYLPGHHYCVMIEEEHKGDFYCGYAKRRTDEQT